MSSRTDAVVRAALGVPDAEIDALVRGEHGAPERVLGAHAVRLGRRDGDVVRAFHPEASDADCVDGRGGELPMVAVGGGLFAAFVSASKRAAHYRFRLRFRAGSPAETVDPYGFAPTIGPLDLHLFGEGTHRRLWEVLGAHARCIDGFSGVSFAVWAPNASRVSVVGDFCHWDGRLYPMRRLERSGVFEIFIPGLEPGALYKFEIRTMANELVAKADPFAAAAELSPGNASRVARSSHEWADGEWMRRRRETDLTRAPMAVYEAHLASWRRPGPGAYLSYRELAPRLIAHVKRFGFTHIELLPITEHPFDGSWGYQTTGYFAPTARHGDPDGLREFVDACHREQIGVILDWVPAHFPRDAFGLRRFDGTALYEHEDPRLGEHPDWGTLIFNYGRHEVRGFLIASALHWLEAFHFDGLRVDAVASMLYLDYSRRDGAWVPNRHGGRENLEAVEFLRRLSDAVDAEASGAMLIAEESTSWPGVTRPTAEGGLGFTFKWNMGWMNDTLRFLARDPLQRRHHLDDLTTAMLYEYSEHFLMPLSHDEVVHGKRSLLEKMPGDQWQRFANVRLLLAYQYTRPGKVLLFMGTELAAAREWDASGVLDWDAADTAQRRGLAAFLEDLGALYTRTPALWAGDPDVDGMEWVDRNASVALLAYARRHGGRELIVILNFTPEPHPEYLVGVASEGTYRLLLNSDATGYGGSGYGAVENCATRPEACGGRPHSFALRIPPLAAVVLERES